MKVVIPQNQQLFHGYFAGLEIACEAARAFGNEPVVLDWFECKGMRELGEHYRHDNPCPPEFVRWTFEQWLMIAAWMEQTHTEVVFKIDSDVLVFENLEHVWNGTGRAVASNPIPCSFMTRQTAVAYRDYIVETFVKGLEVERCEPGTPLDDGHILQPLARRLGGPDLRWEHPFLFVDDNLMVPGDGAEFQGHKDVWFFNGQPIWQTGNSSKRALCLHCWGESKGQMGRIWEQSRMSAKTKWPVRLELEEMENGR